MLKPLKVVESSSKAAYQSQEILQALTLNMDITVKGFSCFTQRIQPTTQVAKILIGVSSSWIASQVAYGEPQCLVHHATKRFFISF